MSNLKEQILQNQKENNIHTNIMTAAEKEAKAEKKAKAKMRKKKGSHFMAFAKGKESTEGVEIKRYIGVASCVILGVCPNKEKLSAIYGRPTEDEPNYLSEADINGVKVPQIRIGFYLKPDPAKYLDADGNPLNLILQKSIYLNKEYRWNKDHTKVQVIDKYGRTAWVTEAELSSHAIPIYKNGNPANIDKDYRPAYLGEEALTNLLIAYLNIPNVQKYDQKTKTWSLVDNPEECEARLENIDEYFKGNISELTDIIAMQPNNKVKVAVGVKSADNGRIYQDVFDLFLKNGNSDYTKLEKEILERKSNGAYPNTEFKVCELCEYKVASTNLSTPSTASMPKQNFDDIDF